MEFKPWLVFLLLASAMPMSMLAEASILQHFGWGGHGSVGDLIGGDNEMLTDSESSRRSLANANKGRYIGYRALRADAVACNRPGRSYYSCRNRGSVNPYNRGCTKITHCARDTDYS